MGCRLVKASEYKDFVFFQRHGELYNNLEEIRYKEIRETFKNANNRMEALEKIFEVLTNDSRLKDIIKEIEKNQNNINVPLHQQENKPATGQNKIQFWQNRKATKWTCTRLQRHKRTGRKSGK